MPKKTTQHKKAPLKKSKKEPATSQKKNTSNPISMFHVFLFVAFSSLFFFYPGSNYYISLFSYKRDTFQKPPATVKTKTQISIPIVNEATASPVLSAQSVYVIDKQTATPLFVRDEHVQHLPASTTKIITALVGADVFKQTDVLEVKRTFDVGQVAHFVQGERLTYENLMYALLVYSANDAAYVIADNYPGGYDAFIRAMNAKAQSLSMKDSHFVNPAGLDADGQVTTAFDLSLAARRLLDNPFLTKVVGIKDITISDVTYTYFHKLSNVNQLLGMIPGIAGLKTGYTENAGENLVTLYNYQGKQYVIVVLKSLDRFSDTKNVVYWLQTAISYTTTTY